MRLELHLWFKLWLCLCDFLTKDDQSSHSQLEQCSSELHPNICFDYKLTCAASSLHEFVGVSLVGLHWATRPQREWKCDRREAIFRSHLPLLHFWLWTHFGVLLVLGSETCHAFSTILWPDCQQLFLQNQLATSCKFCLGLQSWGTNGFCRIESQKKNWVAWILIVLSDQMHKKVFLLCPNNGINVFLPLLASMCQVWQRHCILFTWTNTWFQRKWACDNDDPTLVLKKHCMLLPLVDAKFDTFGGLCDQSNMSLDQLQLGLPKKLLENKMASFPQPEESHSCRVPNHVGNCPQLVKWGLPKFCWQKGLKSDWKVT